MGRSICSGILTNVQLLQWWDSSQMIFKILHLKVCLALEHGSCHVLLAFIYSITALSILPFPLPLKRKKSKPFPKYFVSLFWIYFFVFSSNEVQWCSYHLLPPGGIKGCPTGQSWGRLAERSVHGNSPPVLPWGMCVTLLSTLAN